MPPITLSDLSLRDYGLTPRVAYLREVYFRAAPEICIERPRLVTELHLHNRLWEKDRITILDKAKVYRRVLEKRQPIVRHRRAVGQGMIPFTFRDMSLFAGSTTSKFKGVPLYPEFLALTLWPELWDISRRKSNPYYITEADIEELNLHIFPHWLDRTIQELARKIYNPPEMKLLEKLVFFLASKPNCISHTIPDFSRLINEGLGAIIAEARSRGEETGDRGKKEFYEAIVEVLTGIITYAHNLATEAERMAGEESDRSLQGELLDLAAIYRRVPEFPARNLREGLTAIWLAWIAIHLENPNVGLSLGRLDQVLYPLYHQDREENNLSLEEAIELICLFWLKIGDHVPAVPDAGEQLFGGTGSNQAITLGGVDREGADGVNDLTYIMLRATELMRLRDPNLNARYYPGISGKDYLRRLCEVNINTGATPALHNDRAVIKALMSKGETLEQARDYGIIGCVEPGSNGRFYGHTGALLINLTAALELTLFNGRHRHTGLDRIISLETGETVGFKRWEEFKEAFTAQFYWLGEQAVNLNNILGRIHQDFYPTPILSAFFEGPLDCGRDLIEGGAVINSSGVTIIGLADVADSLSAIQKVVFEEGAVSWEGLLQALLSNFEGHYTLLARLRNPDRTPKYGNEDPLADGNVRWLVELIDDFFSKKDNYRGGRYRVGYWTMTNHAGFGRLTGALPNGRKAGENFASGITPVSGVTPYLTKALNSVAGLPVSRLASGVALNLKYNLGGRGDRSVDDFAASVAGYFDDLEGGRDGGMEIQFNVINRETLIDAARNPEKYPELLVRVSGYTAYFKDLNPQMQKEIIDRTEYLLAGGRMIPWEPFHLRDVQR